MYRGQEAAGTAQGHVEHSTAFAAPVRCSLQRKSAKTAKPLPSQSPAYIICIYVTNKAGFPEYGGYIVHYLYGVCVYTLETHP